MHRGLRFPVSRAVFRARRAIRISAGLRDGEAIKVTGKSGGIRENFVSAIAFTPVIDNGRWTEWNFGIHDRMRAMLIRRPSPLRFPALWQSFYGGWPLLPSFDGGAIFAESGAAFER